jgi:predicted acetyltransferase
MNGHEPNSIGSVLQPEEYRRTGIGKAFAMRVFNEFLGRWEVGQMTSNAPAQAFWRDVVATHTAGVHVEHTVTNGEWQVQIQSFGNAEQNQPAE